MKIAVTGANSFIGKEILRRALKKNWETIAIIRDKKRGDLAEYNNQNAVSIKYCDMDEYIGLGNKIQGADCLINLAWGGTRGHTRMDEKIQRYSYERTLEGIESALKCGCKIIVTAGSQAEYGAYDCFISEEMELHPDTKYGIYKAKLFQKAKKLCEEFGARLIEPRYFSLYGPDDEDCTMVKSTVRKMLRDELCEFTEAIQLWDFMYIEDAVEALFALIENTNAAGAYNFASGDCRPLKCFIEEMKTILESKSELIFGAIQYPDTGMVSIRPDITKLCKAANWKAETSFEEGIINVARRIKEWKI